MLFIVSQEKLNKMIDDRIAGKSVEMWRTLLGDIEKLVRRLDPKKHYILVAPESIPESVLRAAFVDFSGTNVVVLRANDVKLIEISKGANNAEA